jgi:replicative DNA helicase
LSVFYNHEAEKKLLGAIVLDHATIELCGNLRDEDFHSESNRSIMAQIRALLNASRPLDLITLSDAVRCNGGAASMAEIAEITDGTPSAANAPYYIDKIKDCAIRRAGWEKITHLQRSLKDMTVSGAEVLSRATSDLQGIIDLGGGYDYRAARDYVPEFMEYVEDVKNDHKKYDGIKTGFDGIDSILYGLHSEFMVLGARPSIGKTALTLNLLTNITIKQGIPAGMFSIEMSERSLTTRIFSSNTGVRIGQIKTGFYGTGDCLKMVDFAGEMYTAKLFIDDDPGLTLENLRIRARRMVKKDKVRIIFIDHFSLIKHNAKKGEKRYENFIEISAGIKQLTRELGIPIILLCQLGRDSEGREPVLSDLRETGSLEQDADIVAFLHRKRQTDVDNESEAVFTDFIIPKNRDGKTGRAHLIFKPEIVRFVDAPKEDAGSIPKSV